MARRARRTSSIEGRERKEINAPKIGIRTRSSSPPCHPPLAAPHKIPESNQLSLSNNNLPLPKRYIRSETVTLFRRNRHETDAETIDAKLFEAESRLELGVHYQIPYPRHYYKSTGETAAKPLPIQPLYMHSLGTQASKDDLRRRTEHLRALARGGIGGGTDHDKAKRAR